MRKFIRVAFVLALMLVVSACQAAQPESPATVAESGAQPTPPPTMPPTAAAVETATMEAEGAAEPSVAEAAGPVTYTIAAGESSLSYSVGEVFINQNNRFNTAVGVTTSISGQVTLDVNDLQSASIGTISAEIVEFKSDSSRRDKALQDRFLESRRYPTVTFVPTAISGLPETYTPGEEITFQVTGDVTIRDVTKPMTFEVTAALVDDALRGTATTTFLMSDFGFGPISIAGILKTEDEVKITLDFVAYP